MVRKPFCRALWLEVLIDQACVIASIDWRTPVTILLVLQANEQVILLSNWRKEHQRPKAQIRISYNSVLVEGNIDDWFRHLCNDLFSFGCLTVEIMYGQIYKEDYYSIGTSPQAYTGWKNKKTREIMVTIT